MNNVALNNVALNNVASFSENQVYEVQDGLPKGLYMNYYPHNQIDAKATKRRLKEIEQKMGTQYNVLPYDASSLGKSCE